jgi:protein involved in polysaccharide export with SLBB domain
MMDVKLDTELSATCPGRQQTMNPSFRCFAMVAALLCGAVWPAAPAAAQATAEWDAARVYVTREALGGMLAQLEEAAASQAYSERLRERARWEASLIRTRLDEGDFQVGDRIHLRVEGEEALSDTFSVSVGRVLDLPSIGRISLGGVLRSELEDHLRQELGRFIREPAVRARSLIRVSITGEVASQGYYVVPTEVVLSDALMMAGGPTREAKLDGIRIERGRQPIWHGEELARAITEGRTIDQLNLRAGDQIIVPQQQRRDGMDIVRNIMMIVPAITVLLTLIL